MSDHLPINHLEELLLLYSEESNWDYDQLSGNPSITEHVIELVCHKNWNYCKLSKNQAIGLKFISTHPIKKPVFNPMTHEWNRWDIYKFAANPSLDVNSITVEMSKQFFNGPFPLKQMIHIHKSHYQRCNRFFRNEVKNILEQYQQQNCIENEIIVSKNTVFHNQHLGPLSYCLLKLMFNLDQKLEYIPNNSELDERFVELINSFRAGGMHYSWSPCHNCISLEYVTEHDELDYVVGKCTQLSNPSIIQSIYKMYHQIKDYYGNREMPEILKELDYEELEQMSKIGKNRIKDILKICPYNKMYYEDNVLFTQDQFTELVCLDQLVCMDPPPPLPKFTINPNFEWETIADLTWKTYDLKLLSYNSFQQHVQYRKSQILHELEAVGIYLEWNQLDDQMYDDFDAVQFLAKLENTTEGNLTKRFKRIKLLI